MRLHTGTMVKNRRNIMLSPLISQSCNHLPSIGDQLREDPRYGLSYGLSADTASAGVRIWWYQTSTWSWLSGGSCKTHSIAYGIVALQVTVLFSSTPVSAVEIGRLPPCCPTYVDSSWRALPDFTPRRHTHTVTMAWSGTYLAAALLTNLISALMQPLGGR